MMNFFKKLFAPDPEEFSPTNELIPTASPIKTPYYFEVFKHENGISTVRFYDRATSVLITSAQVSSELEIKNLIDAVSSTYQTPGSA